MGTYTVCVDVARVDWQQSGGRDWQRITTEAGRMTAEKMATILNWLSYKQVRLRGVYIGISGGSELAIDIGTQLQRSEHQWMLNRGFVYVDDRYIYRPIIRRKRA